MLTPDAIQSKEFEQSVLGGYRRDEVDIFLDELEEDYRKLYVENADLMEKLKACLAKIEDYKKDEEFLKTAIINAQKLNDTTLKEIELREKEVEVSSKAKAEEIVNAAENEAKSIIEKAEREAADSVRVAQERCRDEISAEQEKANAEIARIQAETNAEQAKLDHLRMQVADFKNTIIELYKAHLTSISKLPEFKEDKVETLKEEKLEPIAEPEVQKEESAFVEEPAPAEEPSSSSGAEEKPVLEEKSDKTVEFKISEKEIKKAVATPEPKLKKPEKFKFGVDYDINNDD